MDYDYIWLVIVGLLLLGNKFSFLPLPDSVVNILWLAFVIIVARIFIIDIVKEVVGKKEETNKQKEFIDSLLNGRDLVSSENYKSYVILDNKYHNKITNPDDLYDEAKQAVMETGKASTSFLQRKLGIGYAQASRLIDMLEENGVIGRGQGAKPRDVLINNTVETN